LAIGHQKARYPRGRWAKGPAPDQMRSEAQAIGVGFDQEPGEEKAIGSRRDREPREAQAIGPLRDRVPPRILAIGPASAQAGRASVDSAERRPPSANPLMTGV
jgi:hypothetical protein